MGETKKRTIGRLEDYEGFAILSRSLPASFLEASSLAFSARRRSCAYLVSAIIPYIVMDYIEHTIIPLDLLDLINFARSSAAWTFAAATYK
jgi:hypothetical protein